MHLYKLYLVGYILLNIAVKKNGARVFMSGTLYPLVVTGLEIITSNAMCTFPNL
jgi:hypothetical protein